MRTLVSCFLLCGLLLTVPETPLLAQSRCPVPQNLVFKVEKEVRRSEPGFTEGLEVVEDALYESTGDLFGETRINRIDPLTGKVTALYNAGHRYFGEGLTLFGDRFYQMTWREHRVFVFDRELKPVQEFSNPREGWGLTHDATRLIASEGSSRLYFLSPLDFTVTGSISVRREGRFVENLNELEYAEGAIWANVFETWKVVKIAPESGCVLGEADLRSLRPRMRPVDRRYIDAEANFIPNGIAHDPKTGLFTVTGKMWPMLYTGRFVENAAAP